MLCKVINTKSVFGGKADIQELVLGDKTDAQFLYRIVGEITGFVEGESKFKRVDAETGEISAQLWTKFAGDFVAINRKGQSFEAVICFLPEYIGGPIKAAIASDGDHNSVQIGFDIYAMFSEKSATSYEFIAQPLRSDEESKVKQMLASMPALPGGIKTPQLEDGSKKRGK